jgi:hypothetical protein
LLISITSLFVFLAKKVPVRTIPIPIVASFENVDIDGDGVDELLGRANMGMEVWRFNAASNGWDMVASGGPFPDSIGWHHA